MAAPPPWAGAAAIHARTIAAVRRARRPGRHPPRRGPATGRSGAGGGDPPTRHRPARTRRHLRPDCDDHWSGCPFPGRTGSAGRPCRSRWIRCGPANLRRPAGSHRQGFGGRSSRRRRICRLASAAGFNHRAAGHAGRPAHRSSRIVGRGGRASAHRRSWVEDRIRPGRGHLCRPGTARSADGSPRFLRIARPGRCNGGFGGRREFGRYGADIDARWPPIAVGTIGCAPGSLPPHRFGGRADPFRYRHFPAPIRCARRLRPARAGRPGATAGGIGRRLRGRLGAGTPPVRQSTRHGPHPPGPSAGATAGLRGPRDRRRPAAGVPGGTGRRRPGDVVCGVRDLAAGCDLDAEPAGCLREAAEPPRSAGQHTGRHPLCSGRIDQVRCAVGVFLSVTGAVFGAVCPGPGCTRRPAVGVPIDAGRPWVRRWTRRPGHPAIARRRPRLLPGARRALAKRSPVTLGRRRYRARHVLAAGRADGAAAARSSGPADHGGRTRCGRRRPTRRPTGRHRGAGSPSRPAARRPARVVGIAGPAAGERVRPACRDSAQPGGLGAA